MGVAEVGGHYGGAMPDADAPHPERLLLLDTASLYFRAFYGVPDSLRSPAGEPVNAVRGLLEMVATLITEQHPTRLVACWDDDWRPAFRVDAIPSYKAHRVAGERDEVPVPDDAARLAHHGGGSAWVEEAPEALDAQVPVIAEALAALGIARVGAPGFEADDVIGTLVTREEQRPEGERAAVDVVTGDRDLFQLVDDAAGVRVLIPRKGVKDLQVVDEAALRERYGVASGQAYADMATLRGDPSDGLPGVVGIGEKTASALLARYGDLAGVLAARDAGDAPAPSSKEEGSKEPGRKVPGTLTATQRRRLTEAADYLAAAPTVVQVVRDAPVPTVDDRLPDAPADPDALTRLAERWGIGSSLARVVDALTTAAEPR